MAVFGSEEPLPTTNSSQTTLHDRRAHDDMAAQDEEKAVHAPVNDNVDSENSEKVSEEPPQPQKPAGPPPPPNGGLVAWLHVLGGFMVSNYEHQNLSVY